MVVRAKTVRDLGKNKYKGPELGLNEVPNTSAAELARRTG